MRKNFIHTFEEIICVENLLEAWKEFVRGKREKPDVQLFSFNLMNNILQLHRDLADKTYRHGEYKFFYIFDPKPRNIHKATVRDRLLHHAVYRIIYPCFDKIFIGDSYSCRLDKGTHKALNRLQKFAYKVSRNNTKTCWVLKCDIKKFFHTIDHSILMKILSQYIYQKDILWLLWQIIKSFSFLKPGLGLPLGNLTSQILVNVYMNEFDQFAKHKLKAKYYIRYADDFVILSEDKRWLESLIEPIDYFLKNYLHLLLHPDKIFIRTLASGVDFLGWVHFPNYRVLRTTTKRRMFKKLQNNKKPASVVSYLGLLKHGNTYKLKNKIQNISSDFDRSQP